MKTEIKLDELILSKGFIPTSAYNKITPKITLNCNWWFGISIYRPDFYLTKGNKTITLSLNGIAMRQPQTKEEYTALLPLLKQCACKYICFRNNNEIVFETYTGEMPSQEILDLFLN